VFGRTSEPRGGEKTREILHWKKNETMRSTVFQGIRSREIEITLKENVKEGEKGRNVRPGTYGKGK